MALDSRTVIVLTATEAFLMGLAMLLATRSYPGQQGGMRTWAWACGVQCLAWLLVAVREILPLFLSIIIANSAFVLAAALYYHAICEFREQKIRLWLLYATVVGTAIGLLPFTYLSPNISIRLIIVSSCITAILFACGLTLLRGPTRKPLSYWLTGICFITIGFGVVGRAVYLLVTDPAQAGRAAEDPVQSVIFAANYVEVILMTFGFVLMRIDKSNSDLLRLATYDSLTGCLNRAAVERQLEAEIARADRENAPLSLMMIDIDHFKSINDSLGHAVGDDAIKTVANSLQQLLRSSDHIGRFGGDEFIVIMPNAMLTQAAVAAERMCAAIEAVPFGPDRDRGLLAVSVGVAPYLEADNVDSLLRKADDALYRAKANGRNCIELALISSENSQAVPSA